MRFFVLYDIYNKKQLKMNKKLINEDIKNMKYLFGYKAGRVISEQDFDYTTDDYLDVDDTELDEDIFAGWDNPKSFKSMKLTKDDDSEDDEDYLEDFGVEDDEFDYLPDEDNDHRDEMM